MTNNKQNDIFDDDGRFSNQPTQSSFPDPLAGLLDDEPVVAPPASSGPGWIATILIALIVGGAAGIAPFYLLPRYQKRTIVYNNDLDARALSLSRSLISLQKTIDAEFESSRRQLADQIRRVNLTIKETNEQLMGVDFSSSFIVRDAETAVEGLRIRNDQGLARRQKYLADVIDRRWLDSKYDLAAYTIRKEFSDDALFKDAMRFNSITIRPLPEGSDIRYRQLSLEAETDGADIVLTYDSAAPKNMVVEFRYTETQYFTLGQSWKTISRTQLPIRARRRIEQTLQQFDAKGRIAVFIVILVDRKSGSEASFLDKP
ncbi:MAG: hypothetical protein ABIH86_07450 [Planctomycetota bacterium]